MNIDAIRAAVRPAVLSDDMFTSISIMERAASLDEGSFVAGRFPEMSFRLTLYWAAFFEPKDRDESIRHWLTVELLWPRIKINSKEIHRIPALSR